MASTLAASQPHPIVGKAASSRVDGREYRLAAIDMVRGLVIVIMALDHVRDFFLVAAEQDPMANPNITVALFVTRWITHFCAPVFVFLAGTSAGLMVSRKSAGGLTRFLFTRGLWLIVVEGAIVSTSATFAPGGIRELGGQVLLVMQVIWAIGVSMIVLAGLSRLGRPACLALGIAIVAGHNLLDAWWPMSGPFDQQWPVWVALHSQMALRVGPFVVVFVYPVLAWIGVMLLGFGSAALFELAPERRSRLLWHGGLAVTAAFVLLRAAGLYGDPNPWMRQPGGPIATAIDFLNTTKYPPSLLFLLMTLGPAAILCAMADRVPAVVRAVLVTFGRAPFAFYVAHIALIHALSVLLGVAQGFAARQMTTMFFFYPKGYGVNLPAVYAVWLLVIALLYPVCSWVAATKARRRDWWLSYL